MSNSLCWQSRFYWLPSLTLPLEEHQAYKCKTLPRLLAYGNSRYLAGLAHISLLSVHAEAACDPPPRSNFPVTQFPYVEEVLFYVILQSIPSCQRTLQVQIPVLRLSKVLRPQPEIGRQTAHLLLPSPTTRKILLLPKSPRTRKLPTPSNQLTSPIFGCHS